MSGSTDNNMEDNSKFPYLNTLNQSCDNSWRMTRYMSGMSVARLASFLAWTGMVCSFIFIIGAIDVIFLPLSFGVAHMCHNSNSFNNICSIFYGVGFPLLFVNIGMFVYSYKLLKTIVNKNTIGMKTFIKIGCYIIGGFELLVSATGIITPLAFIIVVHHHPRRRTFSSRGNEMFIGLLTIPIFISAILVVFISLMIHGVHKFKRRLLNIYIIFKIFLFAVFTLLELVSIILYLIYSHGGIQIMSEVNVFLIYSFFYFYSNGFIVLHYNIMLGKHTEESSMDLNQSNVNFSNNVYFNENMVNHV